MYKNTTNNTNNQGPKNTDQDRKRAKIDLPMTCQGSHGPTETKGGSLTLIRISKRPSNNNTEKQSNSKKTEQSQVEKI